MVFYHMINPVLVSFGPFTIRWYGLFLALAFLLGYWFFDRMLRGYLSQEQRDTVALGTMIAMLIGARLVHVLFYNFSYFVSHPLEILMIWKGGIASHGAMLGGLLAFWYFSKTFKKPFVLFTDAAVLIAPLAGFFVRIGNFFNGELVGRITSVPWAVVFPCCPQPRHPVQFYEAFSYLLVFWLLWYAYKKEGKHFIGFYTGLFFLFYAVDRFIIEFFKDYLILNHGLTMGQWLSIPFFFGAWWWLWKYHKQRFLSVYLPFFVHNHKNHKN